MKLEILYGRDKEFREDFDTLPFIQFPPHWFVKVIGPFGGASIRFLVNLKADIKNSVSVYADLHERLGHFGGDPHWEIYPDIDDNNSRIPIADTDELIKQIEMSLKKMNEDR